MPARVLLVLPNRSYRAAAFLGAARRQGMEVVVASEEPSTVAAPGGRELVIDLGRPSAAAELAARLHGERRLDAVLGVDESSVLVAAAVAERLGLRHHPQSAVAATRDKRRLRERLAAARVPQPRFAALSSADPPAALGRAAAAAGGFPVVVKPVDQAASRGVLRCDGEAELVAAAARIDRLLVTACGRPGPFPLLVEELVDGPEVAVEGLVRGGEVAVLAIFDKPQPLAGPTFEELLLVTPSRHLPATQAALTGMTVTAARALGLRDGPLHAELRIPLAGPVVIEVAARSVGGLCSRGLRFGRAGHSLEELVLRHAAGLGPDQTDRVGPPTGVLMLPVPRAGRLRAVGGVTEARALPHVDGVEITVPLGAEVAPLPEGDRYLGFVFASAPTALEVERALAAARARLDVSVA